MTRSAEDALSQKLSEAGVKQTRTPFSQTVDPMEPGAFGRRVARELFDEYVKERQERAEREKR